MELNLPRMPELVTLHAIPNGAAVRGTMVVDRATGKLRRVSFEANKLKAEGLRPGMLDWHWPLPRGGFHGLWIEHKAPGEKLKPEQVTMAEALTYEGHLVTASDDAGLTIDFLRIYYSLSPGRLCREAALLQPFHEHLARLTPRRRG